MNLEWYRKLHRTYMHIFLTFLECFGWESCWSITARSKYSCNMKTASLWPWGFVHFLIFYRARGSLSILVNRYIPQNSQCLYRSLLSASMNDTLFQDVARKVAWNSRLRVKHGDLKKQTNLNVWKWCQNAWEDIVWMLGEFCEYIWWNWTFI